MMKKLLTLPLLFLLSFSFAQSLAGVNLEHLATEHAKVDVINNKISVKRILLTTGVELEYAEQGNAAGIPVIFLHGITDSWHSFELAFSYLPQHIHAIALSQRGHGNSDKPADGYAPKDFGRDVAAFIQEKGLGPVVIVGHSMGGLNAQQFALDFPKLTKALVIVDSDPAFGNNKGMPEFLKDVLSMKGNVIEKGFMTEFQASTLKAPVDSSYFNLYVEEGLKCPLPVFQKALKSLVQNNLLNKIQQVKVPVAIFWGDHDAVCFKPGQDALKKKLPHARQFTYENTGHALHWEQPERFAKDLIQFINQTL